MAGQLSADNAAHMPVSVVLAPLAVAGSLDEGVVGSPPGECDCGLRAISPLGGSLETRRSDAVTKPGVVRTEPERATRAITRAWASPWAIMLVATMLTVVGAVAVISTGTLLHPQGFAALTAWDALLFVASGLYSRSRRPRARLGTLQILAGFGFCVAPLQAIHVGALPVIGTLVEPLLVLALTYMVLLFPGGRLDRMGKFVCSMLIGVIVTYLPWMLLTKTVGGNTPLGRCAGACPDNALYLTQQPELARLLHSASTGLRLVWSIAFLLTLGYRLVRATAPRRRAAAVVYGSMAMWLVCFAGYTASVGAAGAGSRGAAVFGVGVAISRIALPLGFLVAPLYAQAFAGVALQRIVSRVDDTTSLTEMESLAADTLDDRRMRLAFWLHEGEYVSAVGQPLKLTDPGPNRLWSLIRHGEEPVIAIDHDEALDEEPELINAVGSAVVLVLEKRTVQHELTRSSERIAAARQAERRRMERDLHDSAQQRLIALRMHVDLAVGQSADPRLSRSLRDVGDEIEETLIELRSIAHGVYPALLARDGLAAALTDAASHFGGFVRVEAPGCDRFPEDTEKAVYFCVMEAIQNAAKHGGVGAIVRVFLRVTPSEGLRFEVADSGRGFDSASVQPGFGFASMAERISALGGDISIVSTPGKGTRISGAVATSALKPRDV